MRGESSREADDGTDGQSKTTVEPGKRNVETDFIRPII